MSPTRPGVSYRRSPPRKPGLAAALLLLAPLLGHSSLGAPSSVDRISGPPSPGPPSVRAIFLDHSLLAKRPAGAGLLIGVVGAQRSTLDGAELGLEEVARTAELVGGRVDRAAAPDAPDAASTLAALADAGATVIVAGDAGNWAALEDAARAREVLLMDARPSRPAPGACAPLVFRVGVPGTGNGVVWDENLFRYGATQLNERFQRRFGRGMDPAAWAAWFAVKAAGEAFLRSGSARPDDLAAFLTGPRGELDGHKGVPLRFRADDHQLVQPLYAPGADGGIDEVVDSTPAASACDATFEGARP